MNLLPDFSLLKKNRDFRLLYCGQFISFVGTMITSVALPYQIFHLTHSLLAVGLLSICQLVPLIFTAMMGGVIADRYNRKTLLIYSEIVVSLGCLTLALNAQPNLQHIWVLYVAGGLMAALTGLHRPAMAGIQQQIVPQKDFATVAALSMLMYAVCTIAGPAVGGLFIAHYGLTATYLLDFASYGISLTALLLMSHVPTPERTDTESPWQALKSGVRYAKSRQELLGSYLVDFLAMVFGMPMALFPAMAHAYGDVKVLGMFYAAPAVGALAGALVSGISNYVKRHGVAISISACAWGIAIIFFGLTDNLWLRLFFLALAGAADSISGVFRTVLWNETIPQDLRGRLAGIEMISYISGPRLGDAEASLVASMFGIPFSIISGGVLCVATVVLCSLCLPKYLSYESKQTS